MPGSPRISTKTTPGTPAIRARYNARSDGRGLCFFVAIFQLFSYETFSHFTWYKIRRSRQDKSEVKSNPETIILAGT
jgi:hypothetical protein